MVTPFIQRFWCSNAYLSINEYSDALQYHQRALEIFLSLDDVAPYEIVYTKDQISRSLAALGESDRAMDYLIKDMAETRQVSDDPIISLPPALLRYTTNYLSNASGPPYAANTWQDMMTAPQTGKIFT